MFKVILNNKLDFLHIGRLQQKETITVGFQHFSGVLKFFCLQETYIVMNCKLVLVKMYTTDRKFYKDSLGKLTYVAVENFYNHFWFLFFNLQLKVIIMKKFGECKNLVEKVGVRGDLVTF